ncbi:MAG: hypothetical protein H6819_08640 [Phycisphaerales bacterium]|nr:hypothetical protein [Phycisphaerales bacterium]MCB9855702.1 hypothetical protein [Phycisphaerales bacterium]MCB9862597.1 hypothetical protein [Phycisphaerales bacterium]
MIPIAALISLALFSVSLAQSSIDPVNKFAWGENVGWTNWRDADSTDAGVVVGPTFLRGLIWGENIGYIDVGDGSPNNGVTYANVDGSDFGVNIDADGALHGLAWGENVGWINFDGGASAVPPMPARVECPVPPAMPLARLSGYAWGENIGWLSLDDATHFVSLDAVSSPVLCDMNGDGLDNGDDIQPFIDFVLNAATPNWLEVCSGDVENTPDLMIDIDDLQNFVDCLLTD